MKGDGRFLSCRIERWNSLEIRITQKALPEFNKLGGNSLRFNNISDTEHEEL